MLRVRALVRRNVTNVIEAFLAFTSVCQIPIKFSEPRKRAFCAPALLSNSHIWLCNTTLCMAARMHRSPVTHLRCPGAICRLLFFHGMTREKKKINDVCRSAGITHRRRNRAKTINIPCLFGIPLTHSSQPSPPRLVCGTAAIIGRGERAAALISAAGCSSGLRAPCSPDNHPWRRKQLRTPGAVHYL